jgi:hypothetical protein
LSRFFRKRPATGAKSEARPARVEQLESRVLLTGTTFATAIPIGLLQGGNSFDGTLNSTTPGQIYSFNFITKGTLYFRMRAYQANGEIDVLQDQGTSGTPVYVVIATAEANSNDEGSGNGHINLTAGQYFIDVSTLGGSTSYLMRATADYAGQTLATARNVGTLAGGAVSFSDEVGNFVIDPTYPEDTYDDPLDIYKFTLTTTANVSEDVHLGAGFTAGPDFLVHMELAKDTNHDGTIEANERILESGVGSADEYIPASQLSAGTYYILVDPYGTAYPNYTLTINADYIGNTIATAKPLGTLFGQTQVGESVGITDTDDQYQFKMDQPGEVTADLFGLSDQAGVEIENSYGGAVAFTDPTGAAERKISVAVPAGTYYADVYSSVKGFATNYTLDLTADYAGNTSTDARNIGAVGSPLKLFQDYLSSSDNDDFYKFTIASNNQPFEASIGAEYTDGFFPNLNPVIALFKLNTSNGALTQIAIANKAGSGNVLLATLNAGTYELLAVNGGVNGVASSGNYSIAFQAPPDLAGNDLLHPKVLGTIAGSSSYSDFVGTADLVDMFKFTMAAAGKFDASLFTGVSDVYLQLIQDKNNNGVIDTGDVIAGSFNSTNGATQAIHTTLAAGTYYVRVRYNSGPALTYYELGLDANYAGTTLSTARSFGTLSTTPQTFADEVNEFDNPSDYYKFSLATAGTVSASLSYMPGENTILELIQDKNNNGAVDPGDILVMTADNGIGSALISKSLAAGTYFLRVLNTNGGTNYTISVHR